MLTVIADTHTLKHLLREFKPVRLNTETHSALRLTQKADVTLIKVHVPDNYVSDFIKCFLNATLILS